MALIVTSFVFITPIIPTILNMISTPSIIIANMTAAVASSAASFHDIHRIGKENQRAKTEGILQKHGSIFGGVAKRALAITLAGGIGGGIAYLSEENGRREAFNQISATCDTAEITNTPGKKPYVKASNCTPVPK